MTKTNFGSEYVFHGVYHDVVSPERIVQTGGAESSLNALENLIEELKKA